MTTVLCVHEHSNYYKIPDLDLYPRSRDAYTFNSSNKVIAHPPCPQWSRLKHFAKVNMKEKDLAVFCWNQVETNGGIFEHPAGSSFFKYIGADFHKILSINQSWFGFSAQKRTYLYFNNVRSIPHPITFDASIKKVCSMTQDARSIMPLSFCQWLVDSVNEIPQLA